MKITYVSGMTGNGYSYVMPRALDWEAKQDAAILAQLRAEKWEAAWGPWRQVLGGFFKGIGWVVAMLIAAVLGVVFCVSLVSVLAGPLTGGSLLVLLWLAGSFDRKK